MTGLDGTLVPAPIRTIDAPGHRATAPGGLGVVQALLNSVDIEAGEDELADLDGLRAWLLSRDLVPSGAGLTDEDRRHVVEVREALRDVLTAREAGEPAPDAARRLEEASRRAPVVVQLDGEGRPVLVPATTGVDAVIGWILGEVARAAAEGTWARLKICRNDACRWSFYDVSRNRSGTWCSMAICGNRMKGRAFRARQGRGA